MSGYGRVEGTVWPVDVGEVGWQLRYDPANVNHLFAASVVSAYAHLTDPGISQASAFAALKHARAAVLSAKAA